MNRLLLATLAIIFITSMLFFGNESSTGGFYEATGTIKRISATDAKKLLKFGKLIKLDNDNWVKKCSIGF